MTIEFQEFGRLTALEQLSEYRRGRHPWMCLCACGNFVVVDRSSLISGNTRSCGCLHTESARKQGLA